MPSALESLTSAVSELLSVVTTIAALTPSGGSFAIQGLERAKADLDAAIAEQAPPPPPPAGATGATGATGGTAMAAPKS